MKEKKKEKESEEKRGIWDFRPIMKLLDGIGLEHSEVTNSIDQ